MYSIPKLITLSCLFFMLFNEKSQGFFSYLTELKSVKEHVSVINGEKSESVFT